MHVLIAAASASCDRRALSRRSRGAADRAPALDSRVIPVRGHIYLDRRRRQQHHRLGRTRRRVPRRQRHRAQNADKVLAAIKALQERLQLALPAAPRCGRRDARATNLEPFYRTLTPPKPIRYIANTSALAGSRRRQREDRAGGQDLHRRQRHRRNRRRGRQGAPILAHENVLARLGDAEDAVRRACRPTRTSAGR